MHGDLYCFVNTTVLYWLFPSWNLASVMEVIGNWNEDLGSEA